MFRSQSVLEVALERARELVSFEDCIDGPVSLRRIAEELGVAKIESAHIRLDGYLGFLPDNSLVIRYREDNPRCRNRFTVAHELGHILFAHARGQQIEKRVNRGFEWNHWEEVAVNRIASELLMPEKVVVSEIGQSGSSWSLLAKLSRRFDVSYTAIALRILEVRGFLAVLMRLREDSTRSNDGIRSSWRFTQGIGLTTVSDVSFEAERILRESMTRNKHFIKLKSVYSEETLECGGNRRSVRTSYGRRSEYWVIGWTLEKPPLFDRR